MVNARLHATISCQFYQRPQGLQARHQTSRVFEVNRRFHRRTAATAVIKQACRCHLHCARRLPVLEHPKGSVRRLEMHGKTCNNCSDDTCRSKNGLFGCFPHLVLRLVEALAALVLVAQPMPAIAGEIIQGTPRVADGDTLQIDDKKIRLFGFDAPEKAQLCKNARGADYSCGLQSGEALHNMIGSNPVRCEVRNKDQYGRNVSSCSVLTNKGPVDIGNFMVSNGYAVAYRQYGKDYVALEEAAHQAHKGIWQGTFEMPADWRKDQKIEKLLAQRGRSLPHEAAGGAVAALPSSPSAMPQSSSSSSGPANGCKIKGNINSQGEKIYHMPGGRYYESTQIDLPQGERWFCTERQAKDAGWRASQ